MAGAKFGFRLLIAAFISLFIGWQATGAAPPATAVAIPDGTARYIVELSSPPLATYNGGIASLDATNPNTVAREALRRQRATETNAAATIERFNAQSQGFGDTRVDVSSPASIAYSEYLRTEQNRAEVAIKRIAPASRPLYHYDVTFNGMTVRLTPEQAEAVRRLPGVVQVTAEEPVEWRMDTSPKLIHAVEAWQDSRIGGQANGGKGVRIAIIDTGTAVDHPMFNDEGFTAPPGFPRASRRVGDNETMYSEVDAVKYTNNKVIASHVYINPELQPRLQRGADTPYPSAAHGTHVSGIAAGRMVKGAPNGFGTGQLDLSGVAPAAYIMAYRFDYAYTSDILKAIDDAVSEGADTINNSWGTALMNIVHPEEHPIAKAFKAAVAANVIVVAAAGNAGGVGEASLGGPHQMIDEVITVASSESGRTFSYKVEASGTGLADNLKIMPNADYITFGTDPWEILETGAYLKPICGDTKNDGAKDKIVYVSYSHKCSKNVFEPPTQVAQIMPAFAQQLAGAKQAGAKAIVFYGADANTVAQDVYYLQVATIVARAQLPAELVTPLTAAVLYGQPSQDLAKWAESKALTLKLNITPDSKITDANVDRAATYTSQGPAPEGIKLKPDVAAPGSQVLSSVPGKGYAQMSGTSMASPTVTGCTAIVRQAWPKWTPAEVKAALMTTADPVIKTSGTGQSVAPVSVQGAGRVNLARAIDPGVLVMPPSMNLGIRGGQPMFKLTARDVRRNGSGPVTYKLKDEPSGANLGAKPTMPAEITVPAGGQTEFEISFDLTNAKPGDIDGRIVLEGDGHTVRVDYAGQILEPGKDVLLINARSNLDSVTNGLGNFSDKPDYSEFYTFSLDEAELTYDIWNIDAEEKKLVPPLDTLQRYKMVIVAAGDSNVPLEFLWNRAASTMTPIQMYLLGGGTILASGSKWPNATRGNAQSVGSSHMLSRYFAGWDLTDNDVDAPAELKSVRLFNKTVKLNDPSGFAASDNAGKIDLGRPMSEVDTKTRQQGQPPAPDNGWTYVAFDQIKPFIKSYIETADGKSAMTGVTADATLELPQGGPGITWRALYAGFPIEAVNGEERNNLSRTTLIQRAFQWATEPTKLAIKIQDQGLTPGGEGKLIADVTLPGMSHAASWRWDAGDGRPFEKTTLSELRLTYAQAGTYRVRAELTTDTGHTYVGMADIEVKGAAPTATPARPPSIFLPLAVRDAELVQP